MVLLTVLMLQDMEPCHRLARKTQIQKYQLPLGSFLTPWF